MSKKYLIFILIFIYGIIILSCNSSYIHSNTSGIKPAEFERTKPLSPGQADIEAEVKNITENEKNIVAEISINKVLQYGSTARPLAPGSEIQLFINKSLIKNQKNIFQKGEILLMRISFNHGVNNSVFWNFISFINK